MSDRRGRSPTLLRFSHRRRGRSTFCSGKTPRALALLRVRGDASSLILPSTAYCSQDYYVERRLATHPYRNHGNLADHSPRSSGIL